MWILKILQLLTKPPKRKRPKPGVAEHRIAKTPFVYDPGLWFFKVPRVCGRAFSIRLMLGAGVLSTVLSSLCRVGLCVGVFKIFRRKGNF